MTDFYRTPKFKSLQKRWYKKLKDSGFDDFEALMSTGTLCLRDCYKNPRQIDAYKEDLYRKLRHAANHYPFESDLDRIILECTAEGLTYAEIIEAASKESYRISKISLPKRLAIIMPKVVAWLAQQPLEPEFDDLAVVMKND